jgi:hypothetical protein
VNYVEAANLIWSTNTYLRIIFSLSVGRLVSSSISWGVKTPCCMDQMNKMNEWMNEWKFRRQGTCQQSKELAHNDALNSILLSGFILSYCKNSNLFKFLDKATNKVRNAFALHISIIGNHVVAVACLRNHGPDICSFAANVRICKYKYDTPWYVQEHWWIILQTTDGQSTAKENGVPTTEGSSGTTLQPSLITDVISESC